MNPIRDVVLLLSLACGLASGGAAPQPKPEGTPLLSTAYLQAAQGNPGLQDLASLEPLDTHTHVTKADPDFYSMLHRLHMHIVDILLVDDHDAYRKSMQPQLQNAERVVQESGGHIALCTSFDPFQFGRADFPASAIKDLDRDFADGAVAVKIWISVSSTDLTNRSPHAKIRAARCHSAGDPSPRFLALHRSVRLSETLTDCPAT